MTQKATSKRNDPTKDSSSLKRLRSSLISVAGLIGRPALNQKGQEVGQIVDVICRWNTNQPYPVVSGILVRIARRVSWIAAGDLASISRGSITLHTARLDLRDFVSREGETRLMQEVIDHQLIDINGARVVRAADLYLARVGNQYRLVGVDTSLASLFRRLGPSRWRMRPTPNSVIDWASIQSFGAQTVGKHGIQYAAPASELKRLRPGELADLLEDLGRSERQELLNVLDADDAADALEEMQPKELESLLRESEPETAAGLLTRMEPDEAAEALRDLSEPVRADLLKRMSKESAHNVEEVLSYDEKEAGGFMTTTFVMGTMTDTVSSVRANLLEQKDKLREIDAVIVVDNQGKLVDDIRMSELFGADPTQPLSELVGEPFPVVVRPTASIKEVADLLIANRTSSIVVVDEAQRPIGRILADDVVDALMPDRGLFRFPRIL